MSELIVRAGHNDHRVIEELLGDPAALPARSARHLRRVVVDAVTATSSTLYATATREAGVQLLVDPLTALLTSAQDPGDTWAALPFTGGPRQRHIGEFQTGAVRADLIEKVVQFQLDHGATAIIPPYLHLPRPSGPEAAIVAKLVRETTHYVHSGLGMNLAIFPVLSVNRAGVPLDRTDWEAGIGRLLRTMTRCADGSPFALALSGSAKLNTTNIHKRARIWRRTAAIGPFIAWNAGDLGPLAVTMGASGYETGMCRAERYDAISQARNRAPGSKEPGPRWAGAYVDVLGRSLTLSALKQFAAGRGPMQGDLSCTDVACCARGLETMLGAGRRQHAARRRLDDLDTLDTITARGWKLHHLHGKASAAAHAARRIRAAADRQGIRIGAYPQEYVALEQIVLGLRETARVAIA